jgi:hypothetical protein
MSKNDKQQQSNAGAAASPSRCVQKVLDGNGRFIDDSIATESRDKERYQHLGLGQRILNPVYWTKLLNKAATSFTE